MAITTLDGYIASIKQRVRWTKTATRTTVANGWFSLFDIAGQPGAGSLAAGNTANGLVHTDATNGYPLISPFSGSNKGYVGRATGASTVACRLALFDRVFVAGAYAFNANVTLASQPSFASRIPGGDYNGLELWIEAVTAFTGNLSINVGYQDQDNNAASTGVIATGVAPTIGRCLQLPLAAGDSGLQRINSTVGTVSTVGTYNLMVLRRIWEGRILTANGFDAYSAMEVGLPEVFADSALYAMVCADSTSSGLPDIDFQIVNG